MTGARCAKTRWPTRELATREAVRRALRFRGLHLGTYRCPRCGGWHLTKRRQTR